MSQPSHLADQCLGLDESHLSATAEGVRLHQAVAGPLDGLCRSLAQKGCHLQVVSGYRSFERQLAIFNAKARGERPLLAGDGTPLDVRELSERDCVFAILRWSALPGGSRHHWGTDMDVIDAAALPSGYQVKLTPDEYAPGGVFERLGRVLEQTLDGGASDFYRPYRIDRGGVAPEPWHLSFAPLALEFAQALTPGRLYRALERSDIALKQTVLAHFDALFERFVRVPGEVDRV